MTRSFLYLGLSGLAGLSLMVSGLSNSTIAMADVGQPAPTDTRVLASDEAQIRQLTAHSFL